MKRPDFFVSPRASFAATAICLAGLSATVVVSAPLGDSAVGVGTVLGNAMNPAATPARPLDAEWEAAHHTPTGHLLNYPPALPQADEVRRSASGWEFSGQVEFGVIGGDADERNAQFRTYQDIDNGAYVNNFSLRMKKPEGGYFADLSGGGAGRHDQYYGLEFGRFNAWKVKVFFSETPHVFTDRYKSLWTGIGTANLTLVPGLTPGGTASTPTDNLNVAAAAASAPPMSLSLTRKRSGLRLDADLWPTWKGYVSYSLEQRKGARPLGGVWGNNPGTAPIELAEPIDYDTTDILAGLLHTDGLNAFNLRLSASLFHNNIDTLTFQEPFRIAPPNGVTTVPATGAYTQGRFDLAPSNQAYNARAEYTRALPDFYKGHFTTVISAGKWRQDDNLIPYTSLPNLTLANVTLLPGGNWDTTGALSRQSTDATIVTRLVDLTLSLNPTPALNVKGKARYFAIDNQTNPFLAVNPNASYLDADAATPGNQSRGLTLDGITGVWGRLLNDGSGQSILMGANANPVGNIPIKSNLYSSRQSRFGPSADYSLNSKSTVSLTAEREITQRKGRERDRTWEDKYKLGYVNRGLGDSSLRLSYDYGRRRGSPYVTAYYEDDFSSALVPIPTTPGANVTSWAVRNNSGMRSYDLSDRDQHTGNLRLDTMLRPTLDAGFSLQAKAARYPDAAYGRTRDDLTSANLDLNFQPSSRQSLYGFYSYQLGHIQQASITPSGTVTIGQVSPFGIVTPANAAEFGSAPGGTFYPLLNTWTAKSTDRNHVVGAGLKQEIGKASLNVDYSYATGRTRIGYTYTPGGAINVANAAFAGSRLPDLATDVRYLDAGLRFPLTQRLSARLVYRYQQESIRDWHYQNLDATPVVLGANPVAAPTAIQLDGGPHDYRVQWFGVMFQIKL